ncbi:MAG: FGGY family carbohydrate kinase [Spirochaetales bacterium]
MSFLCIDVGTSGCKACIINEKGQRIAQAKQSYVARMEGAQAEVDTEQVFLVCLSAVKALLGQSSYSAHKIEAVAISSLLGYVFLNSQGKPLRPALLYLDTRATTECVQAFEQVELQKHFPCTGRRLTPELLAPKLLWLQKHELEHWRNLRFILGLKDYLVYRFTGELGTDVAHLNYTFLYDVEKNQFNPVLLDWVGLQEHFFPPCRLPYEVIGGVTRETAQITGLIENTPVVMGSIDGTTAMYGGGMVEEGTLVWVSGSTDVCMTLYSFLVASSLLSQNNSFIPNLYALGGATGLGWGSLLKLKEQFSFREDLLFSSLEEIPPGSEGLYVFPGISGERAPYWINNARGAVVGWGLNHTFLHFLRAFVEGTTYRVKRILLTLKEGGVEVQKVHLLGGGAYWDTVNQLRTDLLGIPMVKLQEEEGTLLGSALFAGVGVGKFTSLKQGVQTWVYPEREYIPDLRLTAEYTPLFLQFEDLLERIYNPTLSV